MGRSARLAARLPHRSAGGSWPLARRRPGAPARVPPALGSRHLPRARQPAWVSAPRAGKRARQLKPLPPPSFELVQTWRSAPPRPSGPGTPRRRFPPSAESAPSRPPAGSRHPTPPLPPRGPGSGPPQAPRLPPERHRAPGTRTKGRRAAPPRRPSPRRSRAHARTRRRPGRVPRRLCVGLAQRLRARRAL